ncbi:MAG TPA: ATP-dependent Clp protease adaptor ClpS [Tepidiformaceae bacterium]|nr:ATP-dependent Clp protease adaptor ClpS [Tepidiformaceae bacterium]
MDTTIVTSPGTRVLEDTESSLEPPYHLILLDDQHHTYQYVILMLGDLFGYSVEKAFAIACVVDSQGQAILMTGSKDEVSRKQEQVHAYGADPWMEQSAGSMSAVIEPAC